MQKAERPRCAAQGNLPRAAGGEMREVAEAPSRADEAALARIVAVHRLPDVVGIGHRRLPVRIVAHPDGAWADRIRLSANDSARAAGNMRKRLECLRDRPVVTRMDERRGGEADEIEFGERRALAVELGEVAEHSAPERGAGERAPRRAIELDRRRTGRPGTAGKRALEIRGRRDEHNRERRAEP